MKTNLYDGIFYINQARSLGELTLVFERIIAEYGFDLFAIQCTTPEIKTSGTQPHFLCNFEKQWVDHYYDSKYYDIDPVISLGKNMRRPYIWDKLWRGIEMNSNQKDFFNEAEEFGVSSGIGLPILQIDNDPGIVSYVSSICNNREVEQIMEERHCELSLLATTLHHAANKFFSEKPHPLAPQLTAREQECLKWAAIGKSDVEIGMILNISTRTVNMHMYNSYKKLDSTSREQAVVKALLMKLISI